MTGGEAAFARALLGPEGVPAGLAPGGLPVERRFAVHRNNVAASLTRMLAAAFPAAERVVGAAFFAAMARAFVQESPPRSPVLLEYGDGLAAFAAGFPPAAGLPYLPDLLRLEAARRRAYHAADARPLDPAALAGLAPDALAGLRCTLLPSAAAIASAWPVARIWAMNMGEAPLAPIAGLPAEEVLVARPVMTVEMRVLPAGGAGFVARLAAGLTLGEAAAGAWAERPAFDLPGTLAALLAGRAIATVQPA